MGGAYEVQTGGAEMVTVTDEEGALVSEQRYLPYGQVRSDVGSITETDIGYTGQRGKGYTQVQTGNLRRTSIWSAPHDYSRSSARSG